MSFALLGEQSCTAVVYAAFSANLVFSGTNRLLEDALRPKHHHCVDFALEHRSSTPAPTMTRRLLAIAERATEKSTAAAMLGNGVFVFTWLVASAAIPLTG